MQRLVIIYNFLCVCVLENFHCEMFKVGGHLFFFIFLFFFICGGFCHTLK